MAKLKVFCATSGFYDSVVAAPSKPAALKAWGAKTDLFSMGVARLVTDPKVAKKALATPGEVIRLKRSGSGADEAPAPRKAPKRAASKRPSRAKLNAAEQRLAKLDETQSKEREAIDRELKAVEKKRDDLLKRLAKARKAAETKLEEAREQYKAALEDWSG